MSQYSWLIDKKREAMAAKLQQRGLPNYSQRPISERYGVSYTGNGADGKVDRSAPAGIAGSPGQQHIYHEGEMRASTPEGDMYVNADTTQKMMMAPTNQDNMEMNMNKQTGKLPGYATGGFVPKLPNNGMLVQPTQVARQSLANTAQTLSGQISNQVNTTGDPSKRRTSSSGVPTDTPTTPAQQNITMQAPVMKAPEVPKFEPIQIQSQPTLQGQMVAPQVREAPKIDPIQFAPVEAPKTITMDAPVVKAQEVPKFEPIQLAPVEAPKTVTMDAPVRETPKIEPVQFSPDLAAQAPKPTEPAATAEDKARGTGLDYLQGTLLGQTGVQLEGQRAMDELSSRQQQERSAAEQRAIQEGLSPDRARAEAQILRDKQESELNTTAAKYGIAGMQEKAQTAANLASQGLAGQQFENEKTKYGDSADWKAYETAIAAGDFTTAAQAYKRVTGNDISMDQMKTNQNYLNTKQTQDIASGNLDLDAKKFNLDTSKMQAMISDINNGVPLDTINKTYGSNLTTADYGSIGEKYKISMDSLKTSLGTQKVGAINDAINKGMTLDQINQQFPDAKLDMASYKAMYDATPLGDRTWERNMSYAKTLLEMEDGTGTNSAEAAKLFNNAFPGIGIDFSKVVTKQKAATFGQGMSQLSDLVAAGMDYNAAIDVMKKNGTLDMMGMDEAGVEKVYRGLKVNAIDEQWKGISESDWYKGLKPEEQTDMSDFFTAVLSGKLDYNVQKEYTVTGKDGTTKTMYFNTEADANSYGTKNGATIVATGKSKVSPVTDVLGGTGSTGSQTNPVEVPSGVSEGGYFNKNGKTYTVDANNNATEVTKVPDNIWGTEATAIIKSGGDMATQLADARATAITDGTKDWKTIKSVDDPVYKAMIESGTGVDGYGDNGKVNPAGVGNDRHSLTNLEDAYNNKTFIKKDGKLYAVTGVSTVKKNWMNWTDYTLTEVGSKDTIKVTAKG